MGTVVAIDGTASSGKGVLSRFIANEYGFHYLDTGLIYRAVAKGVLDAGISLDDELAIVKIAKNIVISKLDRKKLSLNIIANLASEIAAISSVRSALIEIKRSFSRKEPGAVLDGRDIGTVICPNATVKFYLTASLDIRASRRHKEMLENGEKIDYNNVLESLRSRDEQDKNRICSPLVQDKEAYFFDTSKMSVGVMCEVAKGLIDTKLYNR
ncbi:(d)CMP kinase [Candidatus Liberibacter americanus]|uniref:Cytidylate kinase n=1 Tax=Candidatus Liberibacter americanus str. Sao Paulo TaxID=1261131 RepID=U6B6U5_9HYPH|nr:(d)CMP kinase [Candidatus Liberibacter americanus]AHA27467.1 Cytidylate kinase [Candidatus Liberibacter americanus str. Sao Paulo]EMS36572.1 cytidylate kinase [Candidatus Liberibacter americanus PW_SP]